MNFITSIKIKNFFSIKDAVTIDFKASPYNIENNPDRLFEFNGEYYNKIISLYGANSSGKTTVLKAIIAIFSTVIDERSNYFPLYFKNKFSNIEDDSQLKMSFVIDNKKFTYMVTFESNEQYEIIGIRDEKLFLEKEILFDRENQIVANIDENIQQAVFNNLSEKKSLLQEFYKFDNTKTFEKIHIFFSPFFNSAFNIDMLNMSSYTHEDIAMWLSNELVNKGLNDFILSFFESIGYDITKIELDYEERKAQKKELKAIKIFHNIDETEPLELYLESTGTQNLLKILIDIYMMKIMETPLIIDELDSFIHPMLVPIIINLLIKNDIQIIYSTHNIYNMKFIQNDELFLIEKNNKHETVIKAVKNNPNIEGYENLLTHYENGYLGGVPDVKDIITKIL